MANARPRASNAFLEPTVLQPSFCVASARCIDLARLELVRLYNEATVAQRKKKPWSVNFLRRTEAPLRGRLAERVCRFAHSLNLFVRGLPAPPRVHRVPVSQLSRMRVREGVPALHQTVDDPRMHIFSDRRYIYAYG